MKTSSKFIKLLGFTLFEKTKTEQAIDGKQNLKTSFDVDNFSTYPEPPKSRTHKDFLEVFDKAKKNKEDLKTRQSYGRVQGIEIPKDIIFYDEAGLVSKKIMDQLGVSGRVYEVKLNSNNLSLKEEKLKRECLDWLENEYNNHYTDSMSYHNYATLCKRDLKLRTDLFKSKLENERQSKLINNQADTIRGIERRLSESEMYKKIYREDVEDLKQQLNDAHNKKQSLETQINILTTKEKRETLFSYMHDLENINIFPSIITNSSGTVSIKINTYFKSKFIPKHYASEHAIIKALKRLYKEYENSINKEN